MFLARGAGLPVTIYRLGRVTGDSVNGAGSINDFAFLFIKGCIEVARVPDPAPFEIDLIPADYCARALVELSRLPQCIGAVYHLANDKPVSLARFFNVFRYVLNIAHVQFVVVRRGIDYKNESSTSGGRHCARQR